jgi:Pyruvate/2-oxoacid:ferredoxin oxidoreductase delta subunit
MNLLGALSLLLVIIFFTFVFLWILGERGMILRKSTWHVMKEAGLRRNLNLSTLHTYGYGRWLKQYVGILGKKVIPNISHERRKWWTDRYHGKIISIEKARSIINLNRKISIPDLEQVVPYPTAKSLLIDGPPDVVAFECSCRANAENPCTPSQVCMIIGKPFTDFLVEHHPRTARRIDKDEALALLQAEHERGHFHTAWFKDVMMNRFYAICNCCSCCCLALDSMKKYDAQFFSPSGYMAKVDEGACDGCGVCTAYCSFNAIEVNGTAVVNVEK